VGFRKKDFLLIENIKPQAGDLSGLKGVNKSNFYDEFINPDGGIGLVCCSSNWNI